MMKVRSACPQIATASGWGRGPPMGSLDSQSSGLPAPIEKTRNLPKAEELGPKNRQSFEAVLRNGKEAKRQPPGIGVQGGPRDRNSGCR